MRNEPMNRPDHAETSAVVCRDCGNLSTDSLYAPFEDDLCFPCAEGRRLTRDPSGHPFESTNLDPAHCVICDGSEVDHDPSEFDGTGEAS